MTELPFDYHFIDFSTFRCRMCAWSLRYRIASHGITVKFLCFSKEVYLCDEHLNKINLEVSLVNEKTGRTVKKKLPFLEAIEVWNMDDEKKIKEALG